MNAPRFVPWRDDAFCEAESAYSLLNKMSWFLGRVPSQLVQPAARCAGRPGGNRHDHRYDQPERWVHRLIEDPALPHVHGVEGGKMLERVSQQLLRDVPVPWRRRYLAVCPDCIVRGVHLRVHQHMAVMRCPLHPNRVLLDRCPRCDKALHFLFLRHQRPFTCGLRGHNLLSGTPEILLASAAVWARRCRVASNAQAWLDALHARFPLDDARLGPETQRRDQFRALLALEAMLRAHSIVPPWVARVDIPATLALRPRPTPSAAASQTPPRAATYTPHRSEASVDACLCRLRHGMRVTAKEFLVRYSLDHGCLDRPYHLLGEWPRLEASDTHLLQCCPVGIGFWLWRLRWGIAHASLLRAPSFLHRTQVLDEYRSRLVMLVRSHLHMCVVTARQAVRAHKQGQPALPWVQTLRGLIDDAWDPACAMPSQLTVHVTPAGVPSHWDLDVTDAEEPSREPACPAAQPVPALVADKLASNAGGKAAQVGQMTAGMLPFIPMRHDWIFLHPLPIAVPPTASIAVASVEGRCRRAEARWASLLVSEP